MVPVPVLHRLVLVDGERVLAGAADADGAWHVGTDRALHVATGAGWRRIPWEGIDRARFDDDTRRLDVVEVVDFGQPEPSHSLALVEPRRLLDLVRDRVTASVLFSRYAPVRDNRGVKVTARRSPVGGPVEWSFWLDSGLSPDDPQVQAAIAAGRSAAEAELGL